MIIRQHPSSLNLVHQELREALLLSRPTSFRTMSTSCTWLPKAASDVSCQYHWTLLPPAYLYSSLNLFLTYVWLRCCPCRDALLSEALLLAFRSLTPVSSVGVFSDLPVPSAQACAPKGHWPLSAWHLHCTVTASWPLLRCQHDEGLGNSLLLTCPPPAPFTIQCYFYLICAWYIYFFSQG